MAALDSAMQRVLDGRRSGLPSEHWLRTGDPRAVTQGAGYLAFFYACPHSRHHRRPELLAGFKALLADVLANQQDTGALACSGDGGVERIHDWPPHPHYSHGQAWFLEPLLFGLNWLKAEFTPAELDRINRALYRTADFICGRPIHEMNNRGVIVCAVLAMCGRYFGERRFLEEAVRNFHGVPIQVFDPRSGQVFEGSGPDGNYSGTSYEYLYLYRIMSDDVGIDPAMVRALKWYGRVMDPNGRQTFFGASTRVPVGDSAYKALDILPALERYSPEEPFFQAMIEQYLPLMETQALGSDGHSICPTIWALLEHPAVTPPAQPPDWYADMRTWYHRQETGPEHFYYNEGYDSLYFPVRQAYTTCVALRGRGPYKDLQSWTWGAEPPTVYPGQRPGQASCVRAWGLDTAAQNCSGVKIVDFCWVEGDPPGLIARWEGLWRYYVFGRETTLIVTGGPVGRTEHDWVVDAAECGRPEVGDGVLCYAGRRGRLHFPGPRPAVIESGNVLTHRFAFDACPVWFALSNETFRLLSFGPGWARFRDSTGEYEARFTHPGDRPDKAVEPADFSLKGQRHLQVCRTAGG
jgi:hypothetical protein